MSKWYWLFKVSDFAERGLASIVNDKEMLEAPKLYAERIVEDDEFLDKEENLPLKNYLSVAKGTTLWSKISWIFLSVYLLEIFHY